MSDPDITPEDALQVAQRALAKVGDLEHDLEETEAEVKNGLEDLTALKLRVQERDESTDYSQLQLDDRVGIVREHAFRRAADGHGRAKLERR